MFPKVGRVYEMKVRGSAQKGYQKLPNYTGRRLRFRAKVSLSFFREFRSSIDIGKVEGV